MIIVIAAVVLTFRRVRIRERRLNCFYRVRKSNPNPERNMKLDYLWRMILVI